MWNGIIRFQFFHGHPLFALSLNPPTTIQKELRQKLTARIGSISNRPALPLINDCIYWVPHAATSSTAGDPSCQQAWRRRVLWRTRPLRRFIVCLCVPSERVELQPVRCWTCVRVCIYARAAVTNKAECACESPCLYLCLCVSTGCPQSDLPRFFFFNRRRACLCSLSGTCPSSAASCRVLWELSDPPAISIHVFVKLFSIGKSTFVWLRTLGWVLLWRGRLSDRGGFCACSAQAIVLPLSWYLNAGHSLGPSMSGR